MDYPLVGGQGFCASSSWVGIILDPDNPGEIIQWIGVNTTNTVSESGTNKIANKREVLETLNIYDLELFKKLIIL